MKIKGRYIYNKAGEFAGRIIGNRPHVNDIFKGAKADFAIIWADGRRECLSHYWYFSDVVNWIKFEYANI